MDGSFVVQEELGGNPNYLESILQALGLVFALMVENC